MKLTMGKLIGIIAILAIIITGIVHAANVNDTTVQKGFIANQSLASIALAMTAYEMYSDESVSGTTVIYKRYKSGTGTVFISKQTTVVTGDYTSQYLERASDTWANRFTATYSPINE